MKKQLLSITLLIIQLLCSKFVFAQFFPETVSDPCINCVPAPSYSIVSGTPSVSNRTLRGGQFQWTSQQGVAIQLPSPSSVALGYQSENFGTDKYETFVSLLSGPVGKDKVKFIVSGFIPGMQYTMEYAVSSSRTFSSTFGSSAILEIGSVEPAPVLITTSKTDFGVSANSVNQWYLITVQFTAPTPEISFALSGSTNSGSGYVNFDIWSKPLYCILPPDKQVELTSNTISTKFPCKSVSQASFDNTIKLPLPTGAQVVWKTSASLNSSNLTFLNQEFGPGEYYAFYYHAANSCYSLEAGNIVSTAKVTIVHTPTQVPLNLGNSITVHCPNSTYGLNNKLAPSKQGEVRWFDNKNRQGVPIPNETVSTPGTYYAFYYDPETNCYSVDVSTSSVTVSFETPCCKTGTDQVSVQPTTISNICPAATADLTKTTQNFNVPPNTQLVWFNNPTHTGIAINNPSAVGMGTYYVFIFDPALGCYNTDNSTAQVKVTISLCASNVQLSLKAALQGAMPGAGAKMKNELQTYGGTGLLPTASPHPVAASVYPSINNVAGPVGEVVDWILVEVRNGSSPQTVLQVKSLLLKPDGSIVDRNGLVPSFNAQAGAVRLVLKHRNHLAIMSNLIQNFTAGSTIDYDFRTALSQASSVLGDPSQMVQKNGIWCMWAGDINASQDLGVDASDVNEVFSINEQAPVDVYSIFDLNMDGGVDANDSNLIFFNNLTAPYSSLSNY